MKTRTPEVDDKKEEEEEGVEEDNQKSPLMEMIGLK